MLSDLVTPPYVAEMVTLLLLVTVLVVTVKPTLVLPLGTVTEAGTWAAAVLLLVRGITVSCGGPGAFRVSVPGEGSPPITLERLTERDTSIGLTVRVSDLVTPA